MVYFTCIYFIGVENLNNYIESKVIFNVHLGGENSIEIKEYIKLLNVINNLFNYVSSEVYEESTLNLKVIAEKKGSFDVIIQAVITISQNLLTINNISVAKNCLDIFLGLIKLKSHIKGNKPKSIKKTNDYVTIENNSCEKIDVHINVYNLYNDASDEMLTKLLNNNRDSIEITENKTHKSSTALDNVRNTKKISPNTINNLENIKLAYMFAPKIEITENKKIQTNTNRVSLKIKKPDLFGKSQWELLYDSNSIKANIKDTEFITNVHEGIISISGKTRIIADLITKSHYDNKGNIIKKYYTVTKVYEVN